MVAERAYARPHAQKTENISHIPPFKIGGITFQCFIESDGVNELGIPATRYVWRSGDNRLAAGRNRGSSTCWAVRDRNYVGRHYPGLKEAMLAAVRAI